jgi:hypothetical protein
MYYKKFKKSDKFIQVPYLMRNAWCYNKKILLFLEDYLKKNKKFFIKINNNYDKLML